MKHIHTILITLFLVTISFAQETKWTRIEFEKTVSVSVPDGFLVDVEKNDANRKYRILYYNNDFQIDLNISKSDNPQNTVNRSLINVNDSEKTEIDNIVARKFVLDQNYIKRNWVLIGTKQYYYNFKVITQKESDDKFANFVNSIKINGKSIFPQKSNQLLNDENFVVDSELKTSPEIFTALNRKVVESEDYTKVATEKDIMNKPNLLKGNTFRQGIILEPQRELITKTIRQKSIDGKKLGKITFRIELRSNGEVVEIKVFSTVDESTIKLVVKAIRKTKFLPAQVDGKNVDFYYILQTD